MAFLLFEKFVFTFENAILMAISISCWHSDKNVGNSGRGGQRCSGGCQICGGGRRFCRGSSRRIEEARSIVPVTRSIALATGSAAAAARSAMMANFEATAAAGERWRQPASGGGRRVAAVRQCGCGSMFQRLRDIFVQLQIINPI
ncbi:unnamed protein product [Cuscuta epithymum]|uniref:Uncharacterized protein n=1 Tax=Cuscuta epithymum TaxID=186058 RepID=A0AAV0EX14_9ASTE|nr:unnamed protein product [Cuscuta epithymum]